MKRIAPEPSAPIVGSEGIAVEVAAHLPDGSIRNAANLFRFDDAGKLRPLGIQRCG